MTECLLSTYMICHLTGPKLHVLELPLFNHTHFVQLFVTCGRCVSLQTKVGFTLVSD